MYQGFENEGIITQGANGNYADNSYLSIRTVSKDTFSLEATGGSQSGHDITTSVATDDDDTTYWVSATPNSDTFHNCVIAKFDNPVMIEAVLIDSVYQTKNGRTFSGFPIRFKIYSSLNDEEYTLRGNFLGTPDESMARFQFVLPDAVNCTKLKLEFVEVTPFVYSNDGSLYAGAAKFLFIQKITGYDVINYRANTGYAESRVIPTSKIEKYWSTGDASGGPVDSLFDEDDSDKSYWESSSPSSSTPCPSVFVNFTQPLKLEEILFGANKGSSNNYGFPTKLNVYAAQNNDEELKLIATFQGSPGKSKIYQFPFREPIVCTRIQLEFVEAPNKPCLNFMRFVGEMIDFSTGDQDDFSTQHVNNSYPLYGIDDTNFVVNDLPADDDYLFIVEKTFYFNNVSFSCPDALMSAIKSNHSNQVTVKQCNFSSCSVKNSNGNGGAILSLNCVFKCDDSQFTSCNSKANGGGGGIYIALNEKINEGISIKNCVFKKCSATFGGAVYLYSNVATNSVRVEKCTFESNTLIDPSSDASLIGGSAIYLNARKLILKRCKFITNSGDSACKMDNNFDNVPAQLLNEIDAHVLIENCQFEIDPSAKSSISYLPGSKKSFEAVVSNCVFTGKLLDGAHHISVDSRPKQGEKSTLNIESCKFACDKVKSINLNLDDLSNSMVVFNLNNQVFDYDEKDDVPKSNSKSLFIATVSLVAVAVIVLISVIVIVSKKKALDDNNEKNDPLNCSLEDSININCDSSAFV